MEGIEECDDGNTNDTDGCSNKCKINEGWKCVGSPSVCERLCPNGVLEIPETCDIGLG